MVPNGWEQTTISSISKTIMGFAFKSTDFVADGMPLIRMGNLYQNQLQLDRNPVFLPTNFAKEYERFVLRSGDLVMSMTGTMGKRDYGFTVQIPENTQDCLLNQRVMKFEEKSNSNRGFLKYLLKSEHVLTRLYSFPGGTKQANLSAKQVGEIPVLLPPLPEQRKIAQILSTWDRSIATTEKLIDASKQQKKALMQQLLTGKKRLVDPETGKAFEGDWEEVKLGEICDVKGGKRLPKGESLQEHPNAFPYIRVADMHMGGVDLSNLLYVPVQIAPSIKNYTITSKDLFITVAGTLGLVGKIPKELDGANLTENADKLTNITCNQVFLMYVLMSPIIQKHIDAESTQNAQPKLALTRIRGFSFNLPENNEQKRIASVLTAADKDIELLEAKLAHLKQEKKALMQQLLTGKRRVKVPETEAA